MKMFILLFSLLFLVIIATAGCADTDKIDTWFEYSANKVWQNSTKPLNPKHTVDLAGARNETEAFQIVLMPKTNIKNIKINVSDLKSKNSVISYKKIDIYKVNYIPLGDTGKNSPDALTRLGELDLTENNICPIWFTVNVDESAKPGIYNGIITITGDGIKPIRYTVKYEVYNFTLPKTPSCKTAFGILREPIFRYHGVVAGTQEAEKLYKNYYDLLLSRKISSYDVPAGLPGNTSIKGHDGVAYNIISKEAEAYLTDPKVTSFVIPYSEDRAELKKVADYLKKIGVFNKGFYYPVDEAGTKEQYSELIRKAELIKSVVPDAHIITTMHRRPIYDPTVTPVKELKGLVNVWCISLEFLLRDIKEKDYYKNYVYDDTKEREEQGDWNWWYVCWKPYAPYVNFLADMDGMNHRMLFWQQYQLGYKGLLYWTTTYWNPVIGVDSPWKTLATVKDLDPNCFADGSMLYPSINPKDMKAETSVRLELAREGIDDYEYIAILDKKKGEGYSKKFLKELGFDMSNTKLEEFTHDPAKLEKVRREIAKEIQNK